MRGVLWFAVSEGYGAIARLRNLVAAALLFTTPVLAQNVTVAALGDSLTQGFGLPVEDGFVPQLQNWLEANGQAATIINAGVSGDTTAGGLARAEWTLTPDVDALMVTLGGNDVLRGLDPNEAKANIAGILEVAADRGIPVLLSGMRAPGNFGQEYKEQFDALYAELAEEYGTFLYPSFLSTIEDQPDRAAALAQYVQADGIHPNAAGVALIVEGIGPSVLELIKAAQAR